MAGALKALGIKLEESWEEGVMVVHGCAGRFPVEVGDCWGHLAQGLALRLGHPVCDMAWSFVCFECALACTRNKGSVLCVCVCAAQCDLLQAWLQ